MCNCGKGVKEVKTPGDSERSLLMPKSGQVTVWFYSPSQAGKIFATHGGLSGMVYYFRHDQETLVRAGDAEWFVQNPNSWVKSRPDDATLARRGDEYSIYNPTEIGIVAGTLTYNFSSGVSQRVLNIDLPLVQAAIPGTVS